jgi:HEAT repeat protein
MSRAVDPRERASIHHDLASPDEEIRRLAVERLVLLAPHEALPILAERLGDESWRVRKAAVECLVAAPPDWPVAEPLVAALGDGENPGRRNAAVEALVRLGRRMVEPLLAAAGSPDVDVRKLVVDALAGIGSERAVPRLVGLLADVDPNVRSAAADGLGAIGGAEAVAALCDTVVRGKEETLVRLSALRALARLEVPLTAAGLAAALSDSLLRPAAYAVLGHADDPEGEEVLLKGLGSSSRAAREAAVEALLRVVARAGPGEAERLGARIREAALAAPHVVADAATRLESAELGVRLQLVSFLGLTRASEAVLPLLAAARDEALAELALGTVSGLGAVAEQTLDAHWSRFDTDLRILACDVLGRTPGTLGGARLAAALSDPDPGVRAAAAQGLARRGAPEAIGPLLRRLEDTAGDAEPETEEERAAVTEAVVQLAEGAARAAGPAERKRALALLVDALDGAEPPVRLAIARALGSLGGAEHVSRLALLVQDPSAAVRRAAVRALARLGPGEAAGWLRLALADEDATVRGAAAAARAVSPDPDAASDLERLLTDEDVSVRAAAVRALGELARRAPAQGADAAWAAFGPLLGRALADAAPVVIAAIDACREVAGEEAVAAVRAALSHPDPEVVQSAVGCLRARGGEADLAALVPLLAHPHWAVRAEAVAALAGRRVRSAAPAVLRRLELEQDAFVRDALLRALAGLEEG